MQTSIQSEMTEIECEKRKKKRKRDLDIKNFKLCFELLVETWRKRDSNILECSMYINICFFVGDKTIKRELMSNQK